MRYAVLLAALAVAACSAPPEDTAPVTAPVIADNVYDPGAVAEAEAITAAPITSGPINASPIDSAPIGAAPTATAPVKPPARPASDRTSDKVSDGANDGASDKERLVEAIAANGCVLNATNSKRILDELGIEQERLGEIGGELMREGRVEVVPPAEFRLISGACGS